MVNSGMDMIGKIEKQISNGIAITGLRRLRRVSSEINEYSHTDLKDLKDIAKLINKRYEKKR